MAGQIINRGKGVWLVRVYLGTDPDTGKRQYHNKTIHGPKKDAIGQLTNLLRDRDTGKLTIGAEKLTIGALLDDLLLDYKVNGKRYDWAEMVVRVHLRPSFGEGGISRFKTAHTQKYTAKRQAEGAAAATINRELALLKRAFNLGRISTPPRVTHIPYIPMLQENNVRKGFFEDSEYRALLPALPEHLKPVLAFAYYTGCRRGEILSLQWSQVDLIERVVRLEPGTTKSGEARMIPLDPELSELLVIQKAARDQQYPECPWVFCYDGRRLRDIREGWQGGCRRAGLWEGDEDTGKPTRLFHDLRRSGVRNLVRAGVSEKVAMQISGHKTRSVFDRYNIVSEADLKDAARRLGEYVEAKRGQSEVWHTIRTQKLPSVKTGPQRPS